MQLLYLVHELPHGLPNGLKLRVAQLVDHFAKQGQLSLVGFSDSQAGTKPPIRGQSREGSFECTSVPHPIRIRQRPLPLMLSLCRSIVTSQPYSMTKFHSRQMRATVAKMLAEQQPEVIIASLPMWQYLPSTGRSIRQLDSHNLEHELWRDALPYLKGLQKQFARREARLMQVYEQQVWREADQIIAICAEDRNVIAAHSRFAPTILPVDVRCQVERESRLKLGRLGLIAHWGWHPNAVAMEHFCREILPGIGNSRIVVAGPGVRQRAYRALRSHGVEVLGEIADADAFYQKVDTVCAPYLFGGGVRMKVVEALNRGKTVIGYPLAFRGLNRTKCHSENTITCNTAADMVQSITGAVAELAPSFVMS